MAISQITPFVPLPQCMPGDALLDPKAPTLSKNFATHKSIFEKAKVPIGSSLDGKVLEKALEEANETHLGFPAGLGIVRVLGELCLDGDLFVGAGTYLIAGEMLSIGGCLCGQGKLTVNGFIGARSVLFDGSISCLELNVLEQARIKGTLIVGNEESAAYGEEIGRLEADQGIVVEGNLFATNVYASKGGIRVDGSMNIKENLICLDEIVIGQELHAGFIKTGSKIDVGGSICSDEDIRAGETITAGGSISAGWRIFAGLHMEEPEEGDSVIRCRTVNHGKVACGELITLA